MTHADLSTLDYEACRYEIEQSKRALEAMLGLPVETFAYPFGHWGPAAVAAARDSGFIAAVRTGTGSWAPFEMARVMIGASDPMPVVVLKLTGRYRASVTDSAAERRAPAQQADPKPPARAAAACLTGRSRPRRRRCQRRPQSDPPLAPSPRIQGLRRRVARRSWRCLAGVARLAASGPSRSTNRATEPPSS